MPKHDKRDRRTGQYVDGPRCDACGKPTGVDYFTDDEACAGSDGPGFMLCDRKRCVAKRPADLAGRIAYYAAQRAKNQVARK